MTVDKGEAYVGIDIGTSSIHCCILRKAVGGSTYPVLSIVLNCYHRDRLITPSLGFNKEHLLSCDQAILVQKRFPRQLIHNVKRYFNKTYEQVELDPRVDCYGTLESDANGAISYVYPYDKSHKETMSVPVATALILREVKRLIAVEIPDYDGENATISIPKDWTEDQVTLFQWTLQLAGFREWNLLCEDEALSYQYGFMHSLSWKEEYEDTVLFVDVGYDHCSVFVTEFKEHSTRLLFSQTSRDFSGYQIDRVITAITAEKLAEENVDLEKETASRRAAMVRSCEECKRFFTPDGIDSCEMKLVFANGDHTVTVERAECEERCAERLASLTRLCQQAVECCPGIRSVVLEGGASRVTMVYNAVNGVLQKLDHPVVFKFTGTADEDVCRGCSMYGYVRSLVKCGGEVVDGVNGGEVDGGSAATNAESTADANVEPTTVTTQLTPPMLIDTSAILSQTFPKPTPLDENSDLTVQYRFIVNRDDLLVERRTLARQVQQLLTTCRKAVDPNALHSWVLEVNATLDTLENTLNTSEETEGSDNQSTIERYREMELVLQRVKEEIDACNEKKQYTDLTLFPLRICGTNKT